MAEPGSSETPEPPRKFNRRRFLRNAAKVAAVGVAAVGMPVAAGVYLTKLAEFHIEHDRRVSKGEHVTNEKIVDLKGKPLIPVDRRNALDVVQTDFSRTLNSSDFDPSNAGRFKSEYSYEVEIPGDHNILLRVKGEAPDHLLGLNDSGRATITYIDGSSGNKYVYQFGGVSLMETAEPIKMQGRAPTGAEANIIREKLPTLLVKAMNSAINNGAQVKVRESFYDKPGTRAAATPSTPLR